MRKIYILLVLAGIFQIFQASGTIVIPTSNSEFKMSPTSFSVNSSGGKFTFDLTCDQWSGLRSNSSEAMSGQLDPLPLNVSGFEYIGIEDSGGQVDSVHCFYSSRALLESCFFIFKPNTTDSEISGRIVIHHYTYYSWGTEKKRERTIVATYTQAPGSIPYTIEHAMIKNVYLDSTGTNKNREITYYDEFERPSQDILVGASPAGGDIVSFVEYDRMGCDDSKTYLPYAVKDILGASRNNPKSEQFAYYQSKFGNEANYAYSEKRYGNLSMKLVSSEGGVGEAHSIDNGYHTNYTYRLNTAADSIKIYSIENDSILAMEEFYPAERLTVKRACSYKEEHNPVEHIVLEYTNAKGQLVAKEQFISPSDRRIVYYVYDDQGRERYVIPAIQDPSMRFGRYTPRALSLYCYYNEYDEEDRIIRQCLPDRDYVLNLYDNRGRLAMMQDGNLRKENKWMFRKYDANDRPVLSGIYTGGTYASHKAALQSQTSMYEQRGNVVHGYTNNTYPSGATPSEYLTITYYDDYAWNNNSKFDFAADDALGQQYLTRVSGLTTGTLAKVHGIDSDQWLTTVNYYNDKYEVIQTVSDLYPNEKEIITNVHDFTGNVIQTKVWQTSGVKKWDGGSGDLKPFPRNLNITDMEVVELAKNEYEYNKWFTYDNRGRLLKVEMEITGDTKNGKVALASYVYDDLGQLSTKSIHNEKETTTYSRNISGEMLSADSPSFAYWLQYATDGNISSFEWLYGDEMPQTYRYAYDMAGQLTTALTWEYKGAVFQSTLKHAERGITYDRNGNLLTLRRNDASGNSMHDIAYGYTGNRLTSVRLTAGGQTLTGFTYDANGNMTYDPTKGVHIDYNLLNLPRRIFAGSDEVSYIYSATGEKLAKKAGGSFTYYRSVMVYAGDSLLYIIQPEGTVTRSSGQYTYNYFKTDHTGSTRAMLSAVGGNLRVQQTTDYYPYGLAWSLSNLNKNKYLYSGKEFEDASLGGNVLALYDFGARYYNPILGRWFNVDPRLQFTNPYAYCGNNPVMFIDQDGQFAWWVLGIAFVVGAYVGGSSANDNWNPFQWDWGAGSTWGGIIGGGLQMAGTVLGYTYGLQAIFPGIELFNVTYRTATKVGKVLRLGMMAFNGAHTISTLSSLISNPENAGDIFLGNFRYDENRTVAGQILQGLSRGTWEYFQQGAGYTYSQIRNTVGHVSNVEFFGGATLVNYNNPAAKGQHGITMGNMINGKNLKVGSNMFMHEYGHTIQSRWIGPAYLFIVGAPSIISAAGSEEKHSMRWYEVMANKLSRRYFGNYYGVDWNQVLEEDTYPNGSPKYPITR